MQMLRDQRQARNITQTELAKRLGVPQSFVAKYELGDRRLDAVELVQVVEAIGLLPSKFFNDWFAAMKIK